MKKKIFSVFPKKLSNGTIIYYYTTYDDLGKRHQFSTGKNNEVEAYQFCLERMSKGSLVPNSRLFFEEYTKDWFTQDKCPYHQVRIKKGRTFSKSSIDNKRRILKRHLLTFFTGKKLDLISTRDIESWLSDKRDSGYSHNSCNHYLAVLRLIMGEAKRNEDIPENPVSSVIPYAKNSKEKGILTSEEFKTLFDPADVQRNWGGSELHFLINYTAALTGMRIGELLALTKENIEGQFIRVKHSWDRTYGIKSTKTGKNRTVPIPTELSKRLLALVNKSNSRYIFSCKSPFSPVDHKTVQIYLKRALKGIGISDTERKQRNITFHSWRHFANTKMRERGMADSVVRSILGHESSRMTDLYSHIDVREIDFDWSLVV